MKKENKPICPFVFEQIVEKSLECRRPGEKMNGKRTLVKSNKTKMYINATCARFEKFLLGFVGHPLLPHGNLHCVKIGNKAYPPMKIEQRDDEKIKLIRQI